MNSEDLFKSMSNIDPELIDEAAYELGSELPASIIAARKHAERKKIWLTVVPAAACALLLAGVAGILMSQKMMVTESATAQSSATQSEANMSEDAAPVCEETVYAEEECTEESSTAANSEDTSPANAAAEDVSYEEAEKASDYTAESLTVETEYEDGRLTLFITNPSNENYSYDGEYMLYRKENEKQVPVDDVNLSGENAVAFTIEPGDSEEIVIDLSEYGLESGKYVIEIGDISAEFEGGE